MGGVRSNNSKFFIGKSFFSLLISLFFSSSLHSQQWETDSIKIWLNEYNTSKTEVGKLELLDNITTALCLEKPKEGIVYAKKLEELAIKLGNSEKLINAYLGASAACRELTRFDEALDFNLKAVKQAEKTHDTLNMAHSYNYLAIFYHVKYDHASAEKYYLKSLDYFKKVKDVKSQYIILSNLSDVYFNTGRKKEAESALERSVVGRKEYGDPSSIGRGYYTLGSFLVNEKKYKAGLLVLDSALTYLLRSGDSFFYFQTIVTKGVGLGLSNNFKASNDLLLVAITKDFVKNNPDLLYETYGCISRNYEKLNNVSEALKFARLEKVCGDSIFRRGNQEALSEAQAKFDTEKQEQQIELLNKESLIHETELRRQKTIKNTFIIGSIIVLAFSVLIFRSLQINRRDKKLISAQKEKLELKNKEVMDSIHYAKRIQSALLPSAKYVEKVISRLKNNSRS